MHSASWASIAAQTARIDWVSLTSLYLGCIAPNACSCITLQPFAAVMPGLITAAEQHWVFDYQSKHDMCDVAAAAELRSALEARAGEATLYRKQYDSLCRKLDGLEERQRHASAAARAKVPCST